MLTPGRVVIKLYGRDAGSKGVVTKVIDDNFVEIITSKRPKPRKCNKKHLEPLHEIIDINDKEAINKALGIIVKSEKEKEVKEK
ncbi:MAG: KOW motif-containing protein [Candidatus Micrarchaeia archaeon]|jgi:ribosomal protein L14E/L6E/L27E